MAKGEESVTDDHPYTALPPDEAFSVLGNTTRIQILRTLGEADGPLTFTALRDRVGIRQGSRFNYHLDKLVGHFVHKTDDGYTLREPGRRVIQAILSGAVTDDPSRPPTHIDFPCLHCGEPVEVSYARGKLRLSCPACGGNFDQSQYPPDHETGDNPQVGNLSNIPLPPAGAVNRSAEEMFRAAATRAHLEALSASVDVCPRCAAAIHQTIESVCHDHDAASHSDTATKGRCPNCDHRHGVRIKFSCTNCNFDLTTAALMGLLNVPEVMTFAVRNDLDVTRHGIEWGWYYDEEILGTDPYEFRFTFHIDDDSLTLTVDENLDVLAIDDP